YLFVEVRRGRTLGKRLMRLRVGAVGGGRAGRGALWWRVAIKALPVLVATAVPPIEVLTNNYFLTDAVGVPGPMFDLSGAGALLWRFAVVYGGGVPVAL